MERDPRNLSRELRKTIIRLHRSAGGGHLGSSLSIVEILAVIFARFFKWSAVKDDQSSGDRFVLSKGHAALAWYCLLQASGRIDQRTLRTFGSNGSALEPHPNERSLSDTHASTGSLGQGLSIGIGLALGALLIGREDITYVIIGDGELNEGQMSEAARCAGHLKLGNLVVVLDDNKMQQDGDSPTIMPVSDTMAAWTHLGWACAEANGHDCGELTDRLDGLFTSGGPRPKLLVANTQKGRGIPFLAGRVESHFPPPLTFEEMLLVEYSLDNDCAS